MTTKTHIIEVNGIPVEVVRKRIKNLHLRVSPPAGRVRVSAPLRVKDAAIRELVIAKFDWIKDHQTRIAQLPTQPRQAFISGEIHYFSGQPYRLDVIEQSGRQRVEIEDRTLHLLVRPGADRVRRAMVLKEWYRQQLKDLIPTLLEKWQPIVGVQAAEWGVKQMKTRWGTCNIAARRIWLNLELAKQPTLCLEYILVHELVHLLERNHNARFRQLMDRFMPAWREADALLRQTSLRHPSA